MEDTFLAVCLTKFRDDVVKPAEYVASLPTPIQFMLTDAVKY